MAFVHRYSPKSVMLPEELPFRRDLVFKVDRLGKPVSASERVEQYDVRTVFYDVFVSGRDAQVVAIGPPLVNLKKYLLPMEILLNGCRVRGRILEFPFFWTCTIDVPETSRGDPLQVLFRFKCFEARILVPPHPFPGLEVIKVLHTLQKNNPISWIVDWCLWHARLHLFKRILIYDNGSNDVEGLVNTLCRVDELVNVFIVDWNFPYGTPRIHGNQFAQIGALNHCRMFFGAASDWIFSLDVDEYLSVASGLNLDCCLRSMKRQGVGSVMIEGWIFPSTELNLPKDHLSIRNYWFREHITGRTGRKYAYRPAFIYANSIHSVVPDSPFLSRIQGLPPKLRKWIASLLLRKLQKRCRGVNTILRYLHIQGGVVYASAEIIHFYHYRGLNTNWRAQQDDLTTKFDTKRHIKDIVPIQLANKIGIRDYQSR